MMDLSLLSVDGTVVANAARTNAYVIANRALFERCDIEVVECDCCDLGDGPYTDPEADGAPWVTADDPASSEFLGVILTGSSLHQMGASRQTSDNPVRGGTAGRQRESGLEATFRGRLYATSGRGMDYGRRWVAWTLRNLDCGPCSDDADAQHEVGYLAFCDADGTAPSCDGERVIVGAKLTAGPTYAGISGDDIDGDPCSRHAQDVEFTFASPSPFVFGPDDCEDVCVDDVSLYDGDAASRWGDDAAVWSTRPLGISVTNDAKVTAASIWGKPAADYFNGVGDTGGDIQEGGTWTDPDHATRRAAVIAGTFTQPGAPAYTLIRRVTFSVSVEYAARSRNWPWDFAMTVVDGDGARLVGVPQGNITGEPRATEGTWKATPGAPQTFAFTVEHPDVGWTVAEVAAFRWSYAVRSRTVATVADALEVTDVSAYAYGYADVGTPCHCGWCRDYCRHVYECCEALPPDGSDAVPVVTVTADDEGVDLHVEVVQGLTTAGGGALSATDSFNRADGPPGSTDGGSSPPLAWTGGSISGNALVVSSPPGPPATATVDIGVVADVSVEAPIVLPTTPDVGEVVMAAVGTHIDPATMNALVAVVTEVPGQPLVLGLMQFIAGVPTDLFTGVAVTEGDMIRLECVGTNAQVYINDVVVPGGPYAYDPSLNTITTHGFFVLNIDVPGTVPVGSFDSFSVEWEGAGLGIGGCGADDDEWRCADACAVFNVAGTGTLVMDGRLRMAFPSTAVYGDGAGPFRWPDACCGPLCICVAARGIDVLGSDAAAASVTVRWVRRYLV